MKVYLSKLLVDLGLADSKSMARRVVFMGAVSINSKKVNPLSTEYEVEPGDKVRLGKREEIVK